MRNLTQSRDSCTLKCGHNDEVPEHIAKELVAAYQKPRAQGKRI